MPTHPASPSSRRNRPAKPALTRGGIVSAAVDILRSEGLQKLTMRRLALELDTGPASLYVYVRNTAELHAALLDELLGVVDLAENISGTWQARLERVLTSYTAVLFDHPGLAQSALVSRPSGVHYVRLLERLLALLDEGTVPSAQAAWGVDLLLQYATSTAAEHSAPNNVSDTDARWNALTVAIEHADPQTHPLVASHSTALLAGEPTARLSWGFRTLITGIENTPITT
ncbi:TetR/AcrR family transcriptional regulator C-terminal domain-containing protein [Rhodococcus sp. NPDC057135]|uniref:TetR/AcrR family transcriptional regulator C-terminal domain-containing protein n=1 Tax=Rhodococcus sp. NPDC057135 TaxID=3346028 RepID=UPI0036363004